MSLGERAVGVHARSPMKRTNQKLTFQKKEFRILDPHELTRVKGGDGEMVLDGSGLIASHLPIDKK